MRDLIPYLDDVIRILTSAVPGGTVERSLIRVRDNEVGGISSLIRYPDASALHLRIWADCSGNVPKWRSYAFDYRANDGSLRFRYDNAAHHPGLPNFPHHVHLPGDVTLAAESPSLREIAARIKREVGDV